ncbi:hypothetical protein ACJMK2_013912 [Sinanodonta woodiana]|uniref:E3 ubiquitin-protein ligase NRDP1 n=1 Tax=Sinanodonta woodiana TaxID=1069815 RepID=A0ABD3UZH6_SINWO
MNLCFYLISSLFCMLCVSVAPQCEHAFCGSCIHEWLTRQPTCPVDRNPITPNQLKPVPRILRNLLSRLQITCENAVYGCTAVIKLDMLAAHLSECEHNPKKPVHCELGCGLVVPKDELKNHNCVRELRGLVQQQNQKVVEMQSELAEHKLQISEQKRELQLLKEYMRSMRVSNPRMREIQSEMENNDVQRQVLFLICLPLSKPMWVSSLLAARVTRWGGMISTPDAVLQAVIKRSLIESGCPSHIVNELMENAHERRWPSGLSTLETRQLNRRQYENYVTKRIPGKQAVVVMYCENQHMPDDLIMEPGLVMIFAHGVE